MKVGIPLEGIRLYVNIKNLLPKIALIIKLIRQLLK